MATSMINNEEKKKLKLIFDALDEEKDGEIECEEFRTQLKEKFDISMTLGDIKKIIAQCDLDFDGKIQFTEFLVACSNKRLLFSAANIRTCFEFIDQNKDDVLC